MRNLVSMLWLCTGCAYITKDEYAHRMSEKAAPACPFPTQFYADTDADGYGNPDVVLEGCEAPEGTVDNADDCDDTDPDAYPGALRAVDEDGDGYGSTTDTVASCLLEAGMSATADDCDDTDPAVNPGASEDCSTDYDDDCSGSPNDEGAQGCSDWYADEDVDGFAGGEPMCMCTATTTHSYTVAEDCDDGNDAVRPDASEVCNDGIDNNCDGEAVGCGYLGDTDSASAAFQITGAVPGALAGADLVYTADVTEDGADDLLIGAYGDAAVTIVSGADPGSYTTEAFHRLTGTVGENLARDIVVSGDLDGDDVQDLVLGAPGATFDTRTQAGTVNIYFGPIGSLENLDFPDARIGGPHGNAYFGRNMGAIGDVNGDGFADILSGGLNIKNIENDRVGAAYVVFGPVASGDSFDGDVSGDIDLIIYGDEVGDQFGSTMTAVGDWSGDGLPDIVIAARKGNDGKGALYGFSSEDLATTAESAWLASSDAEFIIDGVGSGAMTGEGLVADMNDDGLADVLVGAPQRNLDGTQRGSAYLLTDLESGTITDVREAEFRGETDNAHFGTALAVLGSIGSADEVGIAIGAPDSGAGAVYVFTGPFTDSSIDQSDSAGVVTGQESLDKFGTALLGGLDYDDDGQPDLIVGAPDAESKKGRTYLLLGGGM